MKVLLVLVLGLAVLSLLTASGGPTGGVLATDSGSTLDAQAVYGQTELQSSIPNDPYLGRQWALKQIGMPEPAQIPAGSRKVIVAVLDTGIARDHEDLVGTVVAEVNFTDSPVTDDIRGHGTHVAGIIAASSNNATGIAGLAPDSLILNVKVADDDGLTRAAAVASGIIWAVEKGASVINISVEFDEPTQDLEDAVNYAWEHGALVVAAAGNRDSDEPVYPAYFENCVAVAGTRQAGTLAPKSTYGDWVDVVAPGYGIYSTVPGDSYGYKSGTSFATAHVSGLAALLFAVATDVNGNGRVNDEVREAIEAGSVEFDGVVAGRIDVTGSLDEIQ